MVTKKLQRKRILLLAIPLVGGILGILVAVLVVIGSGPGQPVATSAANGQQDPRMSSPATSLNFPPRSIQELVNKADAIAIGRVDSVIREAGEGPISLGLYNDPRDVPPPRDLPFTYYQIDIEEILLDDGFIQAAPALRINGVAGREFDFVLMMRMPVIGDRYLFVLGRNSDDKSYGVRGTWSMLNIDGEVVTLMGYNQKPPSFTDKVVPSDFLQAVKAAIPN